MSDKKHTAIDWMYELYLNQGRILQAQFEQAKELEKEQIMDAFVSGDERGTKDIPFNCEQYYSQKYNQ